MPRLKRLYIYILQAFIPVFCMTFIICLFILLMQFVWKYVEDLVGKGLEPMVIVELFTYVALNLSPMALPLAILLASLMTFGNLGEKYELLAIKAAGISLLRAMRPLIILVAFISLGAFFFQNEVIPKVQVKFKTLLISIRQKSPELDIPENTFYSGIDGYNLYVKSKNKETGMMYNLMIYDISKGFDNMAVVVCDSGNLKMSSNKDYLLLNLYNGQQFSNFQQSGMMQPQTSGSPNTQFVPYMRENFKQRKLIMPFDANFNRMDESSMDGTQISKNIKELKHTIDSLSSLIDTLNVNDRKLMLNNAYLAYRSDAEVVDSLQNNAVVEAKAYDFDSIMSSLSLQERSMIYNDALRAVESNQNDVMFRSVAKTDLKTKVRQHDVELQGKFSLSFACLVFFFIGAPLGAIIRKGGLGMPVVISVIMFIIYYIINNLGYKMARDGIWEVWQGVWLSSFVLFPLGVFITYKAINDSDLFNPEAYGKYLRKIFFIKSLTAMSEANQDRILQQIPASSELNVEPELVRGFELMDSDDLRRILNDRKSDKEKKIVSLSILKDRGADINNFVSQQDGEYLSANMNLFLKSSLLTLVGYLGTVLSYFLDLPIFVIGIVYLVLFLRSFTYYFYFYGKVNLKAKIYNIFVALVSFFIYPISFGFILSRMKKHIKKIQIIDTTKSPKV